MTRFEENKCAKERLHRKFNPKFVENCCSTIQQSLQRWYISYLFIWKYVKVVKKVSNKCIVKTTDEQVQLTIVCFLIFPQHI